MVKDTHNPALWEPKFRYQDKIIITKGFYKSAKGTALECYKQKFEWNQYKYLYRVHFPGGYPNHTVCFEEDYMELQDTEELIG